MNGQIERKCILFSSLSLCLSVFSLCPTPISFWLQIILHAKWPIHGNTHIRLNEANNNPTDGDNSIYRYVQFISFANHFLCIERVRKIGTKWNGKNESTRQKKSHRNWKRKELIKFFAGKLLSIYLSRRPIHFYHVNRRDLCAQTAFILSVSFSLG